MNRPAVGASTTEPTPMMTLGSALAKWRATSRKVWAAKSPRLVNSMHLAPPLAQAWITLRQTSVSGWKKTGITPWLIIACSTAIRS